MRTLRISVVSAVALIAAFVTACDRPTETISSAVTDDVEVKAESTDCDDSWMPSVYTPPDIASLTQSSTVVVQGIVHGYRVEKKRDLAGKTSERRRNRFSSPMGQQRRSQRSHPRQRSTRITTTPFTAPIRLTLPLSSGSCGVNQRSDIH